uniref:Uncharacterized protein n=1 Tax=Sphaerodactylus townsendi TaxID=933632 RepID=A0ACB8F8N0_9SAUR
MGAPSPGQSTLSSGKGTLAVACGPNLDTLTGQEETALTLTVEAPRMDTAGVVASTSLSTLSPVEQRGALGQAVPEGLINYQPVDATERPDGSSDTQCTQQSTLCDVVVRAEGEVSGSQSPATIDSAGAPGPNTSIPAELVMRSKSPYARLVGADRRKSSRNEEEETAADRKYIVRVRYRGPHLELFMSRDNFVSSFLLQHMRVPAEHIKAVSIPPGSVEADIMFHTERAYHSFWELCRSAQRNSDPVFAHLELQPLFRGEHRVVTVYIRSDCKTRIWLK